MDTGFQLRYVCYLRGNKIIIGGGSMYRKILMRACLTGGWLFQSQQRILYQSLQQSRRKRWRRTAIVGILFMVKLILEIQITMNLSLWHLKMKKWKIIVGGWWERYIWCTACRNCEEISSRRMWIGRRYIFSSRWVYTAFLFCICRGKENWSR